MQAAVGPEGRNNVIVIVCGVGTVDEIATGASVDVAGTEKKLEVF